MSTQTLPARDVQIERNAPALASESTRRAYPAREIDAVVLSETGRAHTFTWTHAEVGQILADHLAALLSGTTKRTSRYDVLAARSAYELLVSDFQTGSSYASWPEPRALLDEVLAHAMCAASVSTSFVEN